MVETPNAKEASENAEKYGTHDGIGGAVTEEPRVGDCVDPRRVHSFHVVLKGIGS